MKVYKYLAIIMSIVGILFIIMMPEISIAERGLNKISLGRLAGDYVVAYFKLLIFIPVICVIVGLAKGFYKYILFSGVGSLVFPFLYMVIYIIRSISYPSLSLRWHVLPTIFVGPMLFIISAICYKKSEIT